MDRAETRQPTRDRILSTARLLFHQQGFSAVGINAICNQAGVVKGSFYHFFPSKQALLEAVIEDSRLELLEKLKRRVAEEEDGRSQVLAQFSMILESAVAQQQSAGRILGCNIGTLASELAGSNESAGESTSTAFRQWRDMLEDMVRQGIEDGSIAHTVDATPTAITLLAVIQGMSTLGRSLNNPDTMTEIALTAVKRLLPVRIR
jgi:TetR/AcrR family transcriptional repressor of nem operon